jgi:hypothetical protein
MALQRPHLRMPLQRGANGKLVAVEQESPAHISSQEAAVALCPLGFREERPDFGWRIPFLAPGPPDPQPLVDALDALVPLPQPRDASVYQPLATDPARWTIEVDSEVRDIG